MSYTLKSGIFCVEEKKIESVNAFKAMINYGSSSFRLSDKCSDSYQKYQRLLEKNWWELEGILDFFTIIHVLSGLIRMWDLIYRLITGNLAYLSNIKRYFYREI